MFILNIAFCWNNETEMTLKQETHGISTHQSFLEDCKFITVYDTMRKLMLSVTWSRFCGSYICTGIRSSAVPVIFGLIF